ncbi:LysR family transcriptional regulator [Cronobacter sakazakii]|uniref:LysR family transcriptional regulator n=1 Tax=Cronobacter sakazakii TaxID=28141 RepID=UPI000CFB2BF4|nr:LysR family transcriptional regulator [Cronobacter sakazakii]EMA4766858.1 LysR family transcriptional regulator [Cronobacter sakazakii]MDK1164536.1 LysR family transcriptional regulator [Cronobacter sakazakii]
MSRRFAHLSDVEIFVTIIEKGSITAAAVALGTTASVLSRALTRLETRLGVQLVRRTTRQLSLTQAGRHYFEQACSAFGVFERAERDIQGRGAQTVGHIRLSAPTTYGHYRLPALLQRFAAHYPGITVELNITNRNVDLVAEGYDFAIRLGTLPDSWLVARKLEEAPLCLVAAPAYLRQHGEPHTLAALENHRCLPFIMPSSGRIAQWSLCEEGAPIEWTPKGQIQVSDDILGVISLAVSGAGICQTYDFIARPLMENGLLTEILPQTRGRTRPFSLIYAPHKGLSSASEAFIRFIQQATG